MKVSDIRAAVIRLLMGRAVSNSIIDTQTEKGVIELTENFKFQWLQETGPVVQLIQYQANYDPSFFMLPATAAQNVEINKVNSFFLYLTQPPSYITGTTPQSTGSGYNLTFRTIDTIEVLMNVPGVPIYWTRHNGQVWIASIPDKAYSIFMRYQRVHTFPNGDGSDPIFLPNSWQDIIEYQSAMRCAQELNLSTKASELHTRLYGDNQFQKTGGLEGNPGLMFQRTSQENRDQSTSRKTFRLRMRSV